VFEKFAIDAYAATAVVSLFRLIKKGLMKIEKQIKKK